MMTRKERIEYYKDLDLQNIGYGVMVKIEDVKEEMIDMLPYHDETDEELVIGYADIPYFLKNTDAYELLYDWYDWNDKNYYLDSFLSDKYDNFLAVAKGCTWNGATGYKIVDSVADALSRDYETSIYLNDISRREKMLTLVEYSHDVPMGHTTYVIGLTDKEYEYMYRWIDYGMFDNIDKWLNKRVK